MLAFLASLILATSSPVLTAHLIPDVTTVTLQNRWMLALAMCESNASTTIAIIDTNGYWSRGKYMYQLSTWLKYSKLFGTTRANIFDENLQDKVTRYILDTKGAGDWYTCNKIISSSLGAYPH